jgi:methyltransferase (TIGR00027 family)
MRPHDGTISHVSDTALWVAYYRALESERPDALFHDRHARELAGPEGEAIARRMGAMRGSTGGWPMVVRTKLMDDIIERVTASGEADTVLNLAAGLDARPYRLALPPALRWIEVDLPDMIARKRAVLEKDRPVCALESVALDLADTEARRALFARVGAPGRRVLVVSEGLLVYLSPEAVAALADDLHAVPAMEQWLFDLGSPALLEFMDRSWGRALAGSGSPFKFGPAENTRFFEPHGFRETKYHATWENALRLDRKPAMAWLWQLLSAFSTPRKKAEMRRFSGIVLTRRA